jgi:predicted PurR-regulated permease PerM
MADQPPPTGSLTPFASRVLLGAGLVLGLLLLLLVLWYAVDALLLAFAGVLMAILLRAPADWLARRTRLSEGWALAVVLGVLLLLLVGLGVAVAPQVVQQMQQLQERLPEAVAEIQEWLEQYAWGRWLMQTVPAMGDFQNEGFGELFRQATGLAYTAVQVFFGVLILLFITLYLAIHPRLYTNGLLHLVPKAERARTAEVLGATGHTLRWWLIGTLIRMAAVGVMTFVGLWLLGVPLALLLAVVAFLLDFVPYFGPIVAAVPAVLVAFIEGPQQAFYVLLLYIVVQQVESLIISPVVYHRTIYLPPVITILAQVLLFAMVGALGVILATPLTAVVLVVVKMLYVEQTLGDYDIDQPEKEVGADEIPALPEGRERDGSDGRQPDASEKEHKQSKS